MTMFVFNIQRDVFINLLSLFILGVVVGSCYGFCRVIYTYYDAYISW